MDDKPKAPRKYYTQADFEAGLCDKNGIAIAQGAQTTAPEPEKQPEDTADPAENTQEAAETAGNEAEPAQDPGVDASGQPNPPEPEAEEPTEKFDEAGNPIPGASAAR